MNDRVDPGLAAGNRITLATYEARHFVWRVQAGVGQITLNRAAPAQTCSHLRARTLGVA